MDNQAMKDALLAANTALVEKIGKQPYIRLALSLFNDKWVVGGCYIDSSMKETLNGYCRVTQEDAFASVMQIIADMPSKSDRDLHQFHKMVAEAIDFGNEHGIAADWVNPLVAISRSLAENALPKPKEDR